MSLFKKAEREQVKLRLALTGPSGSGKTYSALSIAHGIGPKIAFVDTENGSSALYADEFKFDIITMSPPYSIQKYLDCMKAAFEAGYDVLVMDSISHAWAGEGGLLDKKGALDMRGGNSYVNWAPITKEHEQFKSHILHPKCHLICTMRSKQDYVLEQDEKGRTVPRKVGLAPIQREGMEFEFDVVLDMAMDHNAQVSKTRIKSYDGKIFKPTDQFGADLISWLKEGKKPEELQPAVRDWHLNKRLFEINGLLAEKFGDDLASKNILLSKLTNGKVLTLGEALELTNETWIAALHSKIKSSMEKTNA